MRRQMRLRRWRRICISKSYKELLYEKNRERRKPLLWYTLLFIFFNPDDGFRKGIRNRQADDQCIRVFHRLS